MDFVTKLLISVNGKGGSYDFILVIVDQFMKMVHYKPVKVTINTLRLAKVILNIVVWHHNLPILIILNESFLFTFKFCLLLCYLLGIK